MDELVKLVTQKAGINDQQAKTAVDTVLNFLKQRLPPNVAPQLDAIIANPNAVKEAEDLGKNLGGMFNKK